MRKRPENPYEDAGGQTKESYVKNLSVGLKIILALKDSTQPQSIEELFEIVNKDILEIVKNNKRRPEDLARNKNKEEKLPLVNESSLYRNIPILISKKLLKEEPPGSGKYALWNYEDWREKLRELLEGHVERLSDRSTATVSLQDLANRVGKPPDNKDFQEEVYRLIGELGIRIGDKTEPHFGFKSLRDNF